jgi:hypothetical protein
VTSIEQQLAADVAALAGGVVVTDSDLAEARQAVQERIRGQRRRSFRGGPALAAAAAVVVLAAGGVAGYQVLDEDDSAGPAGPTTQKDPDADYLTGSAPTRELLEGVWRVDNDRGTLVFDDAGTVRFDRRGGLFTDPRATAASYVIDGLDITVTTTQHETRDCVGSSFVVRASVAQPGILRFVGPSESGTCALLPSGRGALEQVLPTSREMAELKLSTEPENLWAPMTDPALMNGVWLVEGGGHLVELATDGSYLVLVDAGTVVDTGRWSLRNRELALTSSSCSTGCDEGDRLVRGPLEHVAMGTTAIRGAVKQDDCSSAWASPAWILMPHEGS